MDCRSGKGTSCSSFVIPRALAGAICGAGQPPFRLFSQRRVPFICSSRFPRWQSTDDACKTRIHGRAGHNVRDKRTASCEELPDVWINALLNGAVFSIYFAIIEKRCYRRSPALETRRHQTTTEHDRHSKSTKQAVSNRILRSQPDHLSIPITVYTNTSHPNVTSRHLPT